MKLARVKTLGLPEGVRIFQYEEADVTKALKDSPKNLEIVTDIINKYLRQKDALVAARDDLDTYLTDVVKFPTLTKTEKVDGKDVTTRDEKPGEYLDRLVAALIKGEFSHKEFKVEGADNAAKEKSIYKSLQAIVDKLGEVDKDQKKIEVDEKGNQKNPAQVRYAYLLDISRPERVSKPKTPPEYAIQGATQIINGGAERVKAWIEKFAKGFKDPKGIQIDPITHAAFDVQAPKGATAEEAEKVKQSNITALAWAIAEKEAQVREKTKTQTLAEFN